MQVLLQAVPPLQGLPACTEQLPPPQGSLP
jgi:hypothetical protein